MTLTSPVHEEKQPLHDRCGIVAAFSAHDIPFFDTGLWALQKLQTRGYDGAGFWACDSDGRTVEYKGEGMVREVFTPTVLKLYSRIQACVWIYQVRYGTQGNFSFQNVQPVAMRHNENRELFCVAHNGQFSTVSPADDLESDTVSFAKELACIEGVDWDGRIGKLLLKKSGAWSMVIGTKDGLYLARDAYGFRPLVYGHLLNGSAKQPIWVVASETGALEAAGINQFLELTPGNIAKITAHGLKVLHEHPKVARAHCIFENIYIHEGSSRAHLPRSNARHINSTQTVDDFRRRCGKILAREAPLTKSQVDMVIGVPGTGIEGGMSYARALDLPYFQAFTDKDNSYVEQRTFMTSHIDKIYQKVLEHFTFDAQTLQGRKVVLVDDSIVRGNITKGLIYLLKKMYQVVEVHIRVLSPPIDKACHLGVNTRKSHELIAAQHGGDVDKIRDVLSADSLVYMSPPGLREALTGNKYARGFCMGCMVGFRPPIDRHGMPATSVRKRRFKLEGNEKVIHHAV
ncbi:hypothetical protein HY408_01995 [Candidatus Gottesmanbacteria bacterium]|nr:hypothetical protein [Candidatus Gottesmanbacteria bacterium]